MKTTLPWLALAAAALLSGCRTASSPRAAANTPAADIVVTVLCSDPAMRFTGTIVADGHSRTVGDTGSGTYHVMGHQLTCSFKKLGADGRISLEAFEAGRDLGEANTSTRFGGVRAEIVCTPQNQSSVFATF